MCIIEICFNYKSLLSLHSIQYLGLAITHIVPGLGSHRFRMGTNRRLVPTSPINCIPLFYAFLWSSPWPSCGGVTDSPSATTGNSRSTHCRRHESDIESWRGLFSRWRSFYASCLFSLFRFLAESVSRWRSILNTLGGKRREPGLTHVGESLKSYVGTSARHMFARLHQVLFNWEPKITGDKNRYNFTKFFSSLVAFGIIGTR